MASNDVSCMVPDCQLCEMGLHIDLETEDEMYQGGMSMEIPLRLTDKHGLLHYEVGEVRPGQASGLRTAGPAPGHPGPGGWSE